MNTRPPGRFRCWMARKCRHPSVSTIAVLHTRDAVQCGSGKLVSSALKVQPDNVKPDLPPCLPAIYRAGSQQHVTRMQRQRSSYIWICHPLPAALCVKPSTCPKHTKHPPLISLHSACRSPLAVDHFLGNRCAFIVTSSCEHARAIAWRARQAPAALAAAAHRLAACSLNRRPWAQPSGSAGSFLLIR
jgi:hypothetical protein